MLNALLRQAAWSTSTAIRAEAGGWWVVWRTARAKVGLPDDFRFYLRHTGHTLSTQSGATLKDTMVRAGQSTAKAALIYQHSDDDRQQEVADGIDAKVRDARQKAQTKVGKKEACVG